MGRIREVQSSNEYLLAGRLARTESVSTLATFKTIEIAERMLRETISSFRTCFFGRVSRQVTQKMNAKNLTGNSHGHLQTLVDQPLSRQIMHNYRLTGLTPSQKEDGFFVFEQFNELMKNALGEEREVQLCGSAVTGWGSDGSDLDLSLKQLNRDNPREILSQKRCYLKVHTAYWAPKFQCLVSSIALFPFMETLPWLIWLMFYNPKSATSMRR